VTLRRLVVSIRGQRWRLRYARLARNTDGITDYDTRTIRVSPNVAGVERMETELHEVLHAALPDLDELAVAETAQAQAAILWRIGYRLGR
jgi:hypothetical protein